MSEKNVISMRNKVLSAVANNLDGFYLAGGTALSLFYFQHRESYDLDFFTEAFEKRKVENFVSHIEKVIGKPVKLIGEESRGNMAEMLVYSVKVDKDDSLIIDFIQDVYEKIDSLKIVDGVPILSIKDIYLRKLYTTCGVFQKESVIGRKVHWGGRQEAKDFFDLYYLSTTKMPLSEFIDKYCSVQEKENAVLWFRSYDRDTTKMSLGDIKTKTIIDYKKMEKHFHEEIKKLLKADLTDVM